MHSMQAMLAMQAINVTGHQIVLSPSPISDFRRRVRRWEDDETLKGIARDTKNAIVAPGPLGYGSY
jgi:hypothetical protein